MERRPGADKRVREAVITEAGRAMSDALDAARGRLQGPVLAGWSPQDRKDLMRLVRKLADEALAWKDA